MKFLKLLKLSKYFSLFLLLILLSACARTSNPNIQRGSGYNFIEGHPEVRFSAIGFLNEDNQPGINIAANIVYESLIFKSSNSTQQADLTIFVQVQNKGENGSTVESKKYDLEIDEQEFSLTGNQQSYIFEERIEVPSGSYTVNFTVVDNNSDKEITHAEETTIPNPQDEVIDLTGIRMLGKDMDAKQPQWLPITSYTVPGRLDSLMFVFQVTNSIPDSNITLDSNLIKFESDTSIAEPMHGRNFSSSNIRNEGIDFNNKTVLQNSQRELDSSGSIFIEFRFPQQERGNYRFEVETLGDETSEVFKARDFGVKSNNYPFLETPRELAQPLAYLMDDNEYDQLISISDPDSLKEAIDRFWLKNIGNENQATSVIEKYYQRVEEANKQFANYKEGWKTDRGMIYILFGPPWYIYQSFDSLEWGYAYNRNDSRRNFHFEKPRFESEYYPFESYKLQRNNSYFSVENQQVQLWLTGLILKRQI